MPWIGSEPIRPRIGTAVMAYHLPDAGEDELPDDARNRRSLPPSIVARTPTVRAPLPPEEPGAQSNFQFTHIAFTRELTRYNLGPDIVRELPHKYRSWLWRHRLAFEPPRRNPNGGSYNQFPVTIKTNYFNFIDFWFRAWQEAQAHEDHFELNLAAWHFNFEAWNPRTIRAHTSTNR